MPDTIFRFHGMVQVQYREKYRHNTYQYYNQTDIQYRHKRLYMIELIYKRCAIVRTRCETHTILHILFT